MRRYVSIFCIALVLSSCGEQKTEIKIPENVLGKERFSDLICDFAMAEAVANINVKNVPGNKIDSAYAFNPLLDNGIDRKTFDTTIYFYSHHPLVFKDVYDLSLEKLSRLQAARN